MAIYSQTLMDLAPFVLQFMDNQNVSWTLLKTHNDIIITTLFTKFHVHFPQDSNMCTCAKVFFHILPKKKLWKSLVFYNVG
jgi:hypothetical protein